MRTLMRVWIRFFDCHGKRHNASRHMTLKSMLISGIGC